MIEYIYINFEDDLINTALNCYTAEETVFLFPNQASAKIAKQRFFSSFKFSNTMFTTLNNFENEILASNINNKIKLKEEKRTIAFYKSLSQKNKKFLGIDSYFNSIKTAQNFFALFLELNTEMINFNTVKNILQEDEFLSENQLKYFDVMLDVRNDYKNLIHDLGYFDPIFFKIDEKIKYKDYKNFVVVNQYWFTALEKHILSSLPVCKILWQVPKRLKTSNNFNLQGEILPQDLPSNVNINYKVFESKKQMLSGFLAAYEQYNYDKIIDFSDTDSGYYLSAEYFKKACDYSFTKTGIYVVSKLIHQIVTEFKKVGVNTLYNLQTVLDLLANNYFNSFFENKTNLQNFLYVLANRGYLYINKSLKVPEKLILDYNKLIVLLKSFLKFNSLKSIVEFFKDNDFTSSYVKEYTDFYSVFEDICHDFTLLSKLSFFCIPLNSNNILRLWLEYLKPKTLKQKPNKSKFACSVTGLQNTRNCNFNNVAVLNFIQGKLPTLPKSSGFFTEGQRQKLKLKSYLDVKARDKYYFYRLLATSKSLTVFAYYNLERGLEVSSYLEELIIAKKAQQISLDKTNTSFLLPYINHFKGSSFEFKTNVNFDKKFFSFSFDSNKLQLSFYKYFDMLKTCFDAHIKYDLGILQKPLDLIYDYQANITGNWVHDIFQIMFENVVKNNIATNIKSENFTEELFAKAFKKITDTNKFLLCQPHNYSQIYFYKIYKPIVKQGVLVFFNELQKVFGQKNVKINYKDDFKHMKVQEKPIKTEHLDVYIKAKADLIIKNINDECNWIIDYKTGKYSTQKVNKFFVQLVFYLNSYFLLTKPNQSVNGALYFCEEQKLDIINGKFDKINEKFLKNVNELAEEIYNNGYAVNNKCSNDKISRIDIKNEKDN